MAWPSVCDAARPRVCRPARRRAGATRTPHAMSNDQPTLPPAPRVRELIANITRRLGPVCQHMPPEEFAAMVRRMAEVEHKYEQLGAATRDLRR